MFRPFIKRRWYCTTCNATWEDSPPPCLQTHAAHAICGYDSCANALLPDQLTCCEEHGVMAARRSRGFDPPGGSMPVAKGLTGLWLLQERVRLGLTRKQVANILDAAAGTLYTLEVHDWPLLPGWVLRLPQAGFTVASEHLAPSGLTGRWLDAAQKRNKAGLFWVRQELGLSASEYEQLCSEDRSIPKCFVPALKELGLLKEPRHVDASRPAAEPHTIPYAAPVPPREQMPQEERAAAPAGASGHIPSIHFSVTLRDDTQPPDCRVTLHDRGAELSVVVHCNAGYLAVLQGRLKYYMEHRATPARAPL